MKNLDWSQAHALGITGTAVRRSAWTRWLAFRGTLWFIYLPNAAPPDLHVVLNSEFGADEFLASDWTDEPWDDGAGGATSQPPPGSAPPTPPGTTHPGTPPRGWGGGANPSGPGAVNPPAPGTPPPAPVPPGPPPPGGGGGGGTQDPVPDATPAGAPVVTVVFSTDPDTLTGVDTGDQCYPSYDAGTDSPQNLIVEVTIAGGPAGLGTLSVALPGSTTQLGTAWRGFNRFFNFAGVTVIPGGSRTCTVTYSIGGTPYTGTGVFTYRPHCGSSSSS